MSESGAPARRFKKLSELVERVDQQRQERGPEADEAPARGSARQHDRVTLQTTIDFLSDSNFYTGIMDNISEGGVFIATFETAEVGSRVKLEFSLPDDNPPVRVEGEVRWSRVHHQQSDGEVLPGIGLRFLDLSPADRARIELFVTRRETIYFDDEV